MDKYTYKYRFKFKMYVLRKELIEPSRTNLITMVFMLVGINVLVNFVPIFSTSPNKLLGIGVVLAFLITSLFVTVMYFFTAVNPRVNQYYRDKDMNDKYKHVSDRFNKQF
ncbi:hypothetical protein Thu_235 [Bacillus phage Thurquoise]|nr:hypothetical protein Thu_235 [Bacillus phage Thurquoise]